MRPLKDAEMKVLLEKLVKFLGQNVRLLLERTDEKHVFRMQRDRVYYVSERVLKHASNVSRELLISVGTKIGKFTHSGKFHLHITCLELLAQYARYKVWVKPSAELAFLYGNHVTKSGLVRMTEETPQYAGVLVLNQQNTPIGFGLAAQSTELAKEIEPTGYVALHQADIGEYLRSETTIV